MHYDLGYIALERRTLQTIDNPFGTRLSPMSSVHSVTHVSGPDPFENGATSRTRTDDLRFTKPLLYQLSYRGPGGSCLPFPLTLAHGFRLA